MLVFGIVSDFSDFIDLFQIFEFISRLPGQKLSPANLYAASTSETKTLMFTNGQKYW